MTRSENPAFISFSNKENGLIFDDSNHDSYPIKYYNVLCGELPPLKTYCSYFGYVYEGICHLSSAGRPPMILVNGMYFSLTGDFVINKGYGSKVVLIEVFHERGKYPETNFRALNNFGGPIEQEGRLKYIDGCTDSLLIPPVKLGDPCLNHLHFPKGITQTQHTHPSHRIGIVADGEGECITPFGNLPLTKGMIFVIKQYDGKTMSKGLDGKMYPQGQHSFDTKDKSMDVIAFHPDSDFGATDVVHPMINRTIVDGVSASAIDKIRTK